MTNWNTQNIYDLSGKVIIVTGATSGLGKEIATVLAHKNATVVMAVRNTKKAVAVANEIKKVYPKANLDIRELELASLDSVRHFADSFLKDYKSLDVLINNAGIMACPFSLTQDGFEIQMGVNHLGHFALTGLLLPLLQRTKNSRVVATSSVAHKRGNINFEDIHWSERKYNTMQAYSDSKLANLYFTYELSKKLEGQDNNPIVVAAHPGVTSTELSRHSFIFKILIPLFGQKADAGSLPTLRAAFDETVKSGDYFGPDGFMEFRGNAILVKSAPQSYDKAKAGQLWEISEKLTGVKY